MDMKFIGGYSDRDKPSLRERCGKHDVIASAAKQSHESSSALRISGDCRGRATDALPCNDGFVAPDEIATASSRARNDSILLSLLFMMCIIFFTSISSVFAEEKILITVNQFINHTALDAAYNGMHKALEDRHILPNKAKLIVANAQGNISNSVQISKHQASLKPKFMVAIATPAAQTNLKAMDVESSILAFVAVTDPSAANLIREKGVIGVSDHPPISELLEVTRKRLPDKKTLGVIYNAGEINSIKMVERLETEAPKFGFEVKKVQVNNSSDIKQAINKLTSMVDIIYLPQDNTIVSALDSIVSIARKTSTPIIANDPLLVDKGVTLALGTNYFKSGELLGNMIADIIEGKPVSEPIISSDINELRELGERGE